MQKFKKVAVVTGSNKGIGFAIVKSLARKFNGIVYLTARNESLGIKAVKNLQDEGISVNFHQLDIEDSHSIERFSHYLKEKYDGLDVLINNAAIAYHHRENDFTPEIDQVINTIRVNFSSTLNLCNALFPLLRPNARVVNVSSRAGFLSNIKDQNLIDRILSKKFSIEESIQLMDEYIQLAKSGQHKNLTSNCYAMSKIGLNLLTEAQQILFDNDERKNIVVNSCTPGYCATDMTSYTGPLTPEEGAKTPVFLALLPENYDSFKGKFWADEQC
ncbi:carbonyl reductase [NADPH] 1-like, partial [Brachionus plicatilis]